MNRVFVEDLYQRVRWFGRNFDVKLTIHLHLVQEIKNAWSYTSTPPIRLHGMVLN
jgi:hypothetical protein